MAKRRASAYSTDGARTLVVLLIRPVSSVPGGSVVRAKSSFTASDSPPGKFSASLPSRKTCVASCLSMSMKWRNSACAPSSSTSWTWTSRTRSEEHTSELQSQSNLVCRLLLEKKKTRQSTPQAVRSKSLIGCMQAAPRYHHHKDHQCSVNLTSPASSDHHSRHVLRHERISDPH